MKIALGQIDMGFKEPDKAMALCSRVMAEAAEKEADLIVFPEMTLTGFTKRTDLFGEETENSRTISFFRAEAIKNHMAVCFGMAVKSGDTYTNRSLMLNEAGDIIASYGKLHLLWGAEEKYYTGGDDIQLCPIKDAVVSPFVCYDLRFPEPFQAASLKCDVIALIANWPDIRRAHWLPLLIARAIENQCFVIGVNRTGYGGGKLHYFGDSVIISPFGKIIAQAKEGDPLIVCDIDINEVKELRESLPVKVSRRPELYKKLYNKFI